SKSASSNFIAFSSEITIAPVNIAISSSIANLLSPNAGALTTTTFKALLILSNTNGENASPSISYVNKNYALEFSTTILSKHNISVTELIFLLVICIYPLS
ncbi:hypothetical protein, partial [Streptobacillus ratti]|uniref:hypothetical protein n=1 Tax=Streptobacillus ratti TaxID=1720557 RepID=UPI0013014B68